MLFCISFLAGILLWDIWMQAGFFLVLMLMLIGFFWHWKARRVFIISSLLLLLWYAYALFCLSMYEQYRTSFWENVGWDNHTHTLSWTVGELLSVSEFSHRFRVIVTSIDAKKDPKYHDIALSIPPNLSLLPGDMVSAVWKFSFPRDGDNYRAEKQLWNHWIIAEFHPFHTEKTPPQKYSIFVRMRQWFDASLSQVFPSEWHDLLAGILLGQRSQLDVTLRDELKSSGLMHIMVVSGGNVIMLIIFLSLFIRVFHPWIRIGIVIMTLMTFVMLVGNDAAVWRAALMGLIGYGASLWWYTFPRFLLPLWVAVLIALFRPLSLAYDIGLQLSFLSVLCIIAWWKKLTRVFAFLGPFFSEAFALTFAATLGTFPITLFYFDTFSLVWPIANLFAAPALPLLMYSGILTLFVHAFSHAASYIIWYIPWIFSLYLYRVIHIFGSPSWSMVQFHLGTYATYFIILALGLLWVALLASQKSHQS